MGELSVSLLRLGYLAFLWLFVFAALAILRRDVYGTTITRRGAAPGAAKTGRRRGRVPVPSELAAGASPASGLPAPAATRPVGAGAAAIPAPVAAAGPAAAAAGAAAAGAAAAAAAARPGREAEARRRGAPAKLVVKTGALRGTTLPLARSPVVIGRSSTANLVLDDEFASGRHAQIAPRHGAWVLEDLGSTNGTYLGRERIAGPREIAAGQSIRIGNTTLEVLS
ncbi:MAG: FHA domain-containing protein [Bifidobacteriaceae bacterium]|jgi:hypothetical protein|nr:FHA domain-containing protein [Bifidobacteriaceae bacterium]